MVSWISHQVSSYPGQASNKGEDNDDSVAGTEPSSEPENVKCQAYQIQLLRDRYRLLADDPCKISTACEIYVGNFDSVSRRLDGVGFSFALPTAHMCRTHHLSYQAHAKHHTCPDNERTGRGFVKVTKDNRPVTECVHHMKLRSKQEGVGKGCFRTTGDNISVTASKRSSLPNSTKTGKVAHGSSRSESSDL